MARKNEKNVKDYTKKIIAKPQKNTNNNSYKQKAEVFIEIQKPKNKSSTKIEKNSLTKITGNFMQKMINNKKIFPNKELLRKIHEVLTYVLTIFMAGLTAGYLAFKLKIKIKKKNFTT